MPCFTCGSKDHTTLQHYGIGGEMNNKCECSKQKSNRVMDFDEFQNRVQNWKKINEAKLGNVPYRALLGMVEEFGEWTDLVLGNILLCSYNALSKICQRQLKSDQHIRKEIDDSQATDAIGDLFVFMADYCNLRGWSMQEIVQTTWEKVEKRRWQADGSLVVGSAVEATNNLLEGMDEDEK